MTSPEDVTQEPEPVVEHDLQPLEAAFYALVLAQLSSWLAKVAKAVLRPWMLWKMAPSPIDLWTVAPDWNRVVDTVLVPWLRREAAPAGYRRFTRDENVSIPALRDTDAYVEAHIQAVRNYLVRLPQEVFELIRRELAEATVNGESVSELADRVASVLDVTGSENWPSRARVVAITEVNGAANAGWFAAAQATERDLGRRVSKRWLAAHDSRVRATHREADGQVRALSEPFIVGGFPLLYPGDKAGPPEEVINCRCAAATEIR